MTDIRAALDDWQRYAGSLGGALISMGHHVAAKHQAPHEYDAESGLACSIPACLADLANRYRAAIAAASPEPVLSRSVQRRQAVLRGEEMPTFPALAAASPEPERCAFPSCGDHRDSCTHVCPTGGDHPAIYSCHPFQPAPAAPTAEALRDALLDLIAPPMGADIVVDGWRSGMRARLDAIIHAARADERTRLSGITHHEGDGHEDHP